MILLSRFVTQIEARSTEGLRKVNVGFENKIIELQQRLDERVRCWLLTDELLYVLVQMYIHVHTRTLTYCTGFRLNCERLVHCSSHANALALQVKQLQMMSEEVTRSAHTEASKAASEVKRVEQLDQECRSARTRADAAENALEQTKRALSQRDADATSLRSEKDRLHAQVEQARRL